MNKRFIGMLAISFIFSSSVFAAVPQYKVNMRVGLKGSAPISINTVTKSGKKAYISEFSDDGQSETVVEVMARKSQQNSKAGLYMDVTVTKRVRGQKKMSERTQVFAPENQETEFGMNSKGKTAGNLSLAVMAHQL
ncbi:hypothetical protein [Bdellovibrio sp. HCB209]|uniref:hypothetical protein n=1 Tax=Bdellovibrio sp. HCB209 TaxID=3394354 RepID=UPI0039B5A9F6